ncbi:excinuclease ABC subunit UvrA [Derxia gummosa]|uniref:UvrABC system protein A n=1 Tax=Derxia gummosa DSM 723 TaxID=1121388 RepID=A0A8B6X7V8_9BURK|nr:excinuclease ABC subunit UvrA [Derxia gummosa]
MDQAPNRPASDADQGAYLGNAIRIRGARQNNLRNLSLDIPTGELLVVTGVSGSGKSSLVFDTLYAEGQRRYVETFSAYARQFLDRQDRPQVDRIDGVPPAIAIDQTNPVRNSRSTVGTMTELNDHLKLLFARAATLFCRCCARPVRRDGPESVLAALQTQAAAAPDARVLVTFDALVPGNFSADEVRAFLEAQGYTRIHEPAPGTAEPPLPAPVIDEAPAGKKKPAKAAGAKPAAKTARAKAKVASDVPPQRLIVVQDRFRGASLDLTRASEAIEAAFAAGQGHCALRFIDADGGERVERFSTGFHCANCGIDYKEPTPAGFSFNSPLGACEACRGFGRVIGVDFGLVIPDERKSLREGAVKPWQTESFKEAQEELIGYAVRRGIAIDTPWRDMSERDRHWVLEGEPEWISWDKSFPGVWYGVRRFFAWLESKAYKMHIRVLLSKYRSYTQCEVCKGSRLKPDALLWRVGGREAADAALAGRARFLPPGSDWSREQLDALPGLTIHDLMNVAVDRLRDFVESLDLSHLTAQAAELLMGELRSRSRFLSEVGLGYLTLDRQSRTLSGGEVQRINLTTALGTSLVGTLFVLDEPSIGLHPRDMDRVIAVMRRLRDAGNSLVVVEHDPQVMLAADELLEIGPGPGERGGAIVFRGTPEEARELESATTAPDTARAADVSGAPARDGMTPIGRSLTGDWLAGRKRIRLDRAALAPDAATQWLTLSGAREHNLRDVNLRLPLGRLIAVTGVSGSGKSTLITDVLMGALDKHFGRPVERGGEFDALAGADFIADAVMVDQTAIGRTARSNPASYVGAFDAIRDVFARSPEARKRGYTAGTFSFNAGDGRCPVCGGTGFEHVEMQFLSDVYLRCPECDGKRYRPETLEVKVGSTDIDGLYREASIDQVLDMTVNEALHFFHEEMAVKLGLSSLVDVGLDYLKLGQPVPTLSGGEAQRLKLAGHLAAAHAKDAKVRKLATKKKLFLFDEPTTGLHFEDVAVLLRAFEKLLAAGHTLVVIEHNLDLIRAADWIIDLGPEGGDAGGSIVAEGTPAQVAATDTWTGRALAEYERALAVPGGAVPGTGIEPVRPAVGRATAQALASDGKPDASTPSSANDSALLRAAEPRAGYLVTREGSVAIEGGAPVANDPHHRAQPPSSIRIHHAREHNLKNLDVEIPRDAFTVITGPSGSGKSTLAFDILFAEGQRRYLESLNAYARSIVQPQGKPEVDAIHGIPPTVAIEQRTSRGGRKSTVATLTEIYHFLRLLYVKLGTQYCITCNVPVEAQSFDTIAARLMRDWRGQRVGLLAPLVIGRKGVYTDLAKWAAGKGYTHLRVDGQFLPTDKFPRIDRFKEHNIELPVADVEIAPENEARVREALTTAIDLGKGFVVVLSGLDSLAQTFASDPTGGAASLASTMFSTKRACPCCGQSYADLDPRLFSYNSSHGWCRHCYGTGLRLRGFTPPDERERNQSAQGDASWRDAAEDAADAAADAARSAGEIEEPCPACHGARLNPVALAVRFRDRSIAEVSAQSVLDCAGFVDGLQLDGREGAIARDVITEIRARLSFLAEVGLDYLALDRAAPTLSGGEAQRIRLAAQLGSSLQGVCYILDEPTIGLHPRDNRMLLDVLDKLRANGNTLVVVEHDEDTIRRADHVIDIGPGAGVRGGSIVGQGSADELDPATSITGRFLHHPLQHPLHELRPVEADTPRLQLRGAALHNLRGVDADFPLGRLTVVTGVSGSGKSTLAREVLHDNAHRVVVARNGVPPKEPTPPQTLARGGGTLAGLDLIDRVLEVDQTPIGKTPRSCPATYVGIWDEIRKLFADSQDARLRGYTPSRFSFNTSGGRCETCEGQGVTTVEMSFLPDVKTVCEACGGARFNRATLEVKLRGKSIGDVLAMNIDDAIGYFENHPKLLHALKLMQDVGLGYLTLGQPSPTLSGGEAQRIKLVTELAKVRDDITRRGQRAPRTLYVLDEPTVGLHMSDVEKLIHVLHRLVDGGNTVVVIEHDLDLIAEADWLVDLGPEGGTRGGEVVAEGPPAALVAAPGRSHTARILGEFLAERAKRAAG